MKDSIKNKLGTTRERLEEIAGLMADPDVIGDQNQFRDLGMEYARLEPIVGLFSAIRGTQRQHRCRERNGQRQ